MGRLIKPILSAYWADILHLKMHVKKASQYILLERIFIRNFLHETYKLKYLLCTSMDLVFARGLIHHFG